MRCEFEYREYHSRCFAADGTSRTFKKQFTPQQCRESGFPFVRGDDVGLPESYALRLVNKWNRLAGNQQSPLAVAHWIFWLEP